MCSSDLEPVLKLQHAVTRYRIELRVYEASLLSRRSIAKFKRSEGLGGEESIGWYPLEEIIELALSSSGRKVARWLERSREW